MLELRHRFADYRQRTHRYEYCLVMCGPWSQLAVRNAISTTVNERLSNIEHCLIRSEAVSSKHATLRSCEGIVRLIKVVLNDCLVTAYGFVYAKLLVSDRSASDAAFDV